MVVKLEKWTLVVGLADHAGLAVVDGGGKVILPDYLEILNDGHLSSWCL